MRRFFVGKKKAAIFFEYQVWEFYNNKNTQIRTFHYFL